MDKSSKDRQPSSDQMESPRGSNDDSNQSSGGAGDNTAGQGGLFNYLSESQLKNLAITVKILERMVNQNIYDEITQGEGIF